MPSASSDPVSVAAAVHCAARTLQAAGADTPRLDAQLLLAFTLGVRREDLAREPDRVLLDAERARYCDLTARRKAREPLAYLLGERWFYGYPIQVTPAVLIPRPETEMLVDAICQRAPHGARVADIGTGSGCIAVCAALTRPDIRVAAVDISLDALQVAAANAARYGLAERVGIVHGDLTAPLPAGEFAMIVSNPPYIALDDVLSLMPEVRNFEPALALYERAGDGLEYYRRLFPQAREALTADGVVAVEIGFGQASRAARIAGDAGYNSIEILRDGSGIERVVIAQ